MTTQTTNTTKEKLIKNIEYLNEQQCQAINDLINVAQFANYKGLMTLAGIDERGRNKIDSAYPCQYADSIRLIYPNFRKGRYCYDYRSNNYGEMLNLNDVIVSNLLTTLKS